MWSECKEFMAGNASVMKEAIDKCPFSHEFSNLSHPASEWFFGGLMAVAIFIAVLFFLAVYIYFAIALSTIAKKLKHKNSWVAWIPIANLALMLQLGRFNWKWIFLILIPFLGWIALFVLLIIASWRFFEKRGTPGWFSLSILLPDVGGILYLIALGIVAWRKK